MMSRHLGISAFIILLEDRLSHIFIFSGGFLCRKYKEARRGVAESVLAFNSINDTADPDCIMEWTSQETAAQADRLENPAAMDVYEVQIHKG